MQTGIVEANLVNLNREFNLTYIDDLIARKLEGVEKSILERKYRCKISSTRMRSATK
jgi:hypothetical protein